MKKITSIFLVFIFLTSFVGVTTASVVCEMAKACCLSIPSGECDKSASPGCCSEETKLKKLDLDLHFSGERPEIPSLLLFPSWTENFQLKSAISTQHDVSYLSYSSFFPKRDIPILVQNFRL